MAQLKRYTQTKPQSTTRKRPPSDTHIDVAPPRKRGRGNTATHTPTQLTSPPPSLIGLFQTPTAAEMALAHKILGKMPHATALQSLRLHKHINSAALDEAIIHLLRPHMPPHTAALLCSDSFFMTAQNMHRHQKRLKTTMLAHTTTLIPTAQQRPLVPRRH